MTEKDPQDNQEDVVICDCTGTTKGKILSLIEQNADLDKISSATGATTGCGSCDYEIITLVNKHSPSKEKT